MKPVSVEDRGPGERTLRLRVSVDASDGRTAASTTTALTPAPDAPASAVSRLPLREGSVIVRVELLEPGLSSRHFHSGHRQTSKQVSVWIIPGQH
ncbi:hypothetical protein [Streptomyces sp. NPDC096030]|uniref:hypothetical protein n=1 Tax=Streptomyces sp. NPDC096030 TaxID=3155423 RepID=UPI00332AAB26